MLNSKISFNGIFKALDISKKAAKDVYLLNLFLYYLFVKFQLQFR